MPTYNTPAKRKYPFSYASAVSTRKQKYLNRTGTLPPRNATWQSTYMAQKPKQGETKAVDVTSQEEEGVQPFQTPFLIVNTGTFTLLNAIPPGAAAWQRQGRVVQMKSLYIRGYFNYTGTAITSPGQFARLVVLYDKQTNGTFPTLDDVLRDQLNSPTSKIVSSVTSGINLNNRSRFEIIVDRTWYLPSNTKSGSQPNAYSGMITNPSPDMKFEIFRKLRMRETEYKGLTPVCEVGDVATGSLIMLWVGGGNDANTNSWNVILSARTKYVDG